MKQHVTLSGLGASHFDQAVRGVGAVYQMFNAELQRRGCELRPWTPSRDATHLALTFSNRYFTSIKAADGEPPIDLHGTVDPLDVVSPLLRGEVHILENVVEYWMQSESQP